MDSAIRIFILSVTLIVLGGLILLTSSMFSVVKQTTNANKSALQEQQTEYEERDINLLSGEVVSAAEAASLARKYKNSVTIYKNGVMLDPTVAGKKSTFSDGSNWVVEPEVNANDVCISINFKSPNDVTSDPATVDEAKQVIADIVGGSYTDDWSSLQTKLQNVSKSESYRKNLATVLGLAQGSDWDTIYQKINELVYGTGSTIKLSSEKKTLYSGESYTYKLNDVSFCYLQSGSSSGVIVFGSLATEYKGDFDSSDVSVDTTTKTITNNTAGQVICTFVVQ